MRALSVEELSWVSGGTATQPREIQTIVVWGNRNGVNLIGIGPGGAGFGPSDAHMMTGVMEITTATVGFSKVQEWWNSYSASEKTQMLFGAVIVVGGIGLLAIAAPGLLGAIGVIASGTATPAALASAWSSVATFVFGMAGAVGGAGQLMGMARRD